MLVRTGSPPPKRFPIGTKVLIQRKAKTAGSWARYAGRTGTVAATNNGEVGVVFGASTRNPVWFRPTELVRI